MKMTTAINKAAKPFVAQIKPTLQLRLRTNPPTMGTGNVQIGVMDFCVYSVPYVPRLVK